MLKINGTLPENTEIFLVDRGNWGVLVLLGDVEGGHLGARQARRKLKNKIIK